MGKFIGTQWGTAKTTAEKQNGFCIAEDMIRLSCLFTYDGLDDEDTEFFSGSLQGAKKEVSITANSKVALLLDFFQSIGNAKKGTDQASLRSQYWNGAFEQDKARYDKDQVHPCCDSIKRDLLNHFWYEFQDGRYIDASLNQVRITKDSFVLTCDLCGVRTNEIDDVAFALVIDNFWRDYGVLSNDELIDRLLLTDSVHLLSSAFALISACKKLLQIHGMPYVRVLEGGPQLPEKLILNRDFNIILPITVQHLTGDSFIDRSLLGYALDYRFYMGFKNAFVDPDVDALSNELAKITIGNPIHMDVFLAVAKYLGITYQNGANLACPRIYTDDKGCFIANDHGNINLYGDQALISPTRMVKEAQILSSQNGNFQAIFYALNLLVKGMQDGSIARFPDVSTKKGFADIDSLEHLLMFIGEVSINHENNVISDDTEELSDHILWTKNGRTRYTVIDFYSTLFNLQGRAFIDAVSALPYTMESGASTKGGLGGGFLELLQKSYKSEIMLNYSPRVAAKIKDNTRGYNANNEVDVLKQTDMSGYTDGHVYAKLTPDANSLYISGRNWGCTSRKGKTRFHLYNMICFDSNKERPDAYALNCCLINGSIMAYDDGSTFGQYLKDTYGCIICDITGCFDDKLLIDVNNNGDWMCMTMVDPCIDLVNHLATNKPQIIEDEKSAVEVMRTRGLTGEQFWRR